MIFFSNILIIYTEINIIKFIQKYFVIHKYVILNNRNAAKKRIL